jgi:hypothetical protein
VNSCTPCERFVRQHLLCLSHPHLSATPNSKTFFKEIPRPSTHDPTPRSSTSRQTSDRTCDSTRCRSPQQFVYRRPSLSCHPLLANGNDLPLLAALHLVAILHRRAAARTPPARYVRVTEMLLRLVGPSREMSTVHAQSSACANSRCAGGIRKLLFSL